MGTEGSAEKNIGQAPASEHISDVHHAISPNACLSRLRDVFDDAVEVPISERKVWLLQNIDDPQERQAIATLLFAHDSVEFIEVGAFLSTYFKEETAIVDVQSVVAGERVYARVLLRRLDSKWYVDRNSSTAATAAWSAA